MAVNNVSTTLRLSGLSSGMDTESIIKSLMQLEQLKVDRQVRSRITLEWKQAAIKSVGDDLRDFRNTFISALSSQGIASAGTYKAYTVKVGGAAADAVTISAGASATAGTTTIKQVKQLATGASVSGSPTSEKLNVNQKLRDVEFAGGRLQLVGETDAKLALSEGAAIYRNAEGETVYKDKDTGAFYSKDASGNRVDLPEVMETDLTLVMKDGDGIFTDKDGKTVYQDKDTGEYYRLDADNARVVLSSEEEAEANLTANKTGGEFSFKINDVEFKFGRDATMSDVMKAVNASSAGVTMKYSELTKTLSVSSKTTGENTDVRIENGLGNAFGAGGVFGIDETNVKAGQNAEVIFEDENGNEITVSEKNNTFSMDGVSYTLNRATEASEGKITLTVARDIDSSVNKIKAFVDGYNVMIKKLEGLLSERKSSSEQGYTALTDAEKAEMTEKQIEEWEAIAKKGLLRNDSSIQTLVSDLRSALYESVSSAGLSPSQIGLRTGSYLEGKKGEIVLDEDALRAALEKDPDQVMNVFTAESKSDDKKTAYKENGLVNRIYDIFSNYTKSQSITSDGLDRSLQTVRDRIDKMETKMLEMEERYYRKFSAMETALAELNSQSSWLAGILGTG